MTATVRVAMAVSCAVIRIGLFSRGTRARSWRKCRHQPRPDPGCPIPDSRSLPRITFLPGTLVSDADHALETERAAEHVVREPLATGAVVGVQPERVV